MTSKKDQSRQSSSSIFSKQKPPLTPNNLNLPINLSQNKLKPSPNPPSENVAEEEDGPQDFYQNPLYQGHFHDENLGHEHIPGEFERPDQELKSEQEEDQDIYIESPELEIDPNKDIFNDFYKDDPFRDSYKEVNPNKNQKSVMNRDSLSKFNEKNDNNKGTLKIPSKNPSNGPSKATSKIASKVGSKKPSFNEIRKVGDSQNNIYLPVERDNKGIEKYDIPGNAHFESITINTQQIMEKTNVKNLESLRNSALPLLSMAMSPQQQEIYYKMYYLKANTSVGIRELALVQKKDQNYYIFLEEKAGKVKEKLRDESRILNYMIESVIRLKKHFEQNLDDLIEKRKTLIYLAYSIVSRRPFEEKLRFELDFLRHKMEELGDLEKEADLLIAIFSTLMDENLRNSIIQEFEHKDIHSIALKKYDEYHDYVNKLDMAIQDYRKYYRLDLESDEFKKRLQSLLAVLFECDDYSKKTFLEIKALNTRITKELQFLIEKMKENNVQYHAFFRDLEDSYNNVLKLIYLRKEKHPLLLNKFEHIDSDITLLNLNEEENLNLLSSLDPKVKLLRKELKIMKKQGKNLRDDPKSQLFLSIRLRQSQKLLAELRKSTSRCNAYLFLFSYFRENLNKEFSHLKKLISSAETLNKDASAFEKNRILSEICLMTQFLEKQLQIKDLARIDHLFRQFRLKLDESYEKLSKYKPVSSEAKKLLSSIQDFLLSFKNYQGELDKNLLVLSTKLDTIDFSDSSSLEKALGLLPIHKKTLFLLSEASSLKDFEQSVGFVEDLEQKKELLVANEFLKDCNGLFEVFTDVLLTLIKLKSMVSGLSFDNNDYMTFEELLDNCLNRLPILINSFKILKGKAMNWEKLFIESFEFLKLLHKKLPGLKGEENFEKGLDKGLLAFLGSKSFKINRFIQDFVKLWDQRFKSLNELKSLGSRASTVKELDQKINRKRLLGLNSWYNPQDLLEVLIFKEYVRNSSANKKLQEELKTLESKILIFFSEIKEILSNLNSNDIPELANILKRLFPENQDLEITVNIYKKGLEAREILKNEVENVLGDTIRLNDENFKKDLIRFNEDIKETFESSKKEIQMMIDAVKRKVLNEELQRDVKIFFNELEAMYFVKNGWNISDLTEFVEFGYLILHNNDLFNEELKEMHSLLKVFKENSFDILNNWEFLQPHFHRILRILKAFNQNEALELWKNENKREKNIIFFQEITDLPEIKRVLKTIGAENWYQIWMILMDTISGKKENDKRYIGRLNEMKERLKKGEFKDLDREGVIASFIDILS